MRQRMEKTELFLKFRQKNAMNLCTWDGFLINFQYVLGTDSADDSLMIVVLFFSVKSV